jgi:hypothetical protein
MSIIEEKLTRYFSYCKLCVFQKQKPAFQRASTLLPKKLGGECYDVAMPFEPVVLITRSVPVFVGAPTTKSAVAVPD